MDLMAKKIVADPKRRSAIMHFDWAEDGGNEHGCQIVFHLLYVNRGRSLWDAMQDAEHALVEGFMQKLTMLFERGLVEVYDNRIYLPLKPDVDKDAVSKLADVLNKSGRWKP